MINLQLTVREAMELANNCHVDIYNKIVNAFEVALGVNQLKTVTITGGMTIDNRIPCIQAIRLHAGCGLKEATAKTGTKQSLTLATPEAAEKLLRELVDLGCEGYLS
jgi:ribosomal protein L7/L12